MVGSTHNELTLIPQNLVSSFEKLDKAVDFFVINNLTSSSQDRIIGENKTQEFTIGPHRFEELNAEEVLIKIYKKSEYDIYKSGSVPVRETIKKASDKSISFKLPPGNYIVHFSSLENDNLIIFNKTIEH
jgi:hypothetical protein